MNIFDETIQLGVEPETLEHALAMAESVIGKTFNEINFNDTFKNTVGDNSKNKGYLGNLFQENIYGLNPNSDKGADLKKIGVELKVIPLIRDHYGKLKSKERIVANIINFEEEDLTGDFSKSSFLIKIIKVYLFFMKLQIKLTQLITEL